MHYKLMININNINSPVIKQKKLNSPPKIMKKIPYSQLNELYQEDFLLPPPWIGNNVKDVEDIDDNNIIKKLNFKSNNCDIDNTRCVKRKFY
jgi:hypothetical protein